jgi:phosphoribosylanthranilate isomerase
MTLVKICGLTNAPDARVAWQCGADLLGFILVPSSPRYVRPERLAEITSSLRQEGCRARLVGVFAAAAPRVMRRVASDCALDLLQLHGQETPEQAASLGLPVILARAVREGLPWQVSEGAHAPSGFPWAYLLDSHDPQRLGGTGKTWRWELLAGTEARTMRVILAGGLNPENVATAIRQVRPWGVDVASGVELSPGHKDADKIRRFIEQVREVDDE